MTYFESAWLIAAVFFILMFGSYLIFKANEKKGKRIRRTIYLGGENVSQRNLRLQNQGYFRDFIEILRFKRLRDFHSGNLTTYLIWVFIGVVIILTILLLTW